MSLEDILSAVQDLDSYKKFNKLEFYKPYGYQLAFHSAKGHGEFTPVPSDKDKEFLSIQRALMCANQIGKCGSVNVYIDTSKGTKKLKDIWGKEDIEVLTYPDMSPRKVTKWVRKPPEECFRITMSSGQWFEAPLGHAVLVDGEWLSISQIFASLPRSAFRGQGLLKSAQRGVLRLTGTVRGYLNRYLVDPHLCGGQLLSDQEGVQVFAPLKDDAQEHNGHLCSEGVQGRRYNGSLYKSLFRLSSQDDDLLTLGQYAASLILAPLAFCLSFFDGTRKSSPSHVSLRRQSVAFADDPRRFVSSSFYSPDECVDHIVSAQSVGVHTLYDMEVEDRHNYIAGGLVHHNTFCGAMETAMHCTGLYPDWWEGHRFSKPVKVLVGSNTNETARDICQREMFGDPSDEKMLGTGSVPKKCIVKTNRKPGVNNAFDSVLVEHVSGGNSEVYFRAYEQGPKKFMGHRYDVAWPDEEPPPEVQSQIARSQFATNGIEYITFTPEEGITEVVRGFLQDLKPGQALVRATWDDAPHMTPELREQKLAGVPRHERAMRANGEPLMGSGLVFSVARDMIECAPFEIPAHWPRINGIDFGWDHPFACAYIAWDRDSDTVYIYDGYKEQRTLPPMHAEAIKRKGDWIPVSWPKDGLQTEKGSGKPLADRYRELGIKMHHTYFTNPPTPGEPEGKGSQSVEAGVMEMLEMMETGRFKVFANVTMFWEELGMYHRKDGKIVPFNDDFMSAIRYAVMFRRHAEVKVVRQAKQQTYSGLSNW